MNKESHLLSATASQEKRISRGTASSAQAVRRQAAHSLNTRTDDETENSPDVQSEVLQLLIATCIWAKSVGFL